MLDLHVPSSLVQLQWIQGRVNFLQIFVPNYAKLTKGFTRLFKKGVPFHLDDTAQKVFDALKVFLARESLLYAPNYLRDYFL